MVVSGHSTCVQLRQQTCGLKSDTTTQLSDLVSSKPALTGDFIINDWLSAISEDLYRQASQEKGAWLVAGALSEYCIHR